MEGQAGFETEGLTDKQIQAKAVAFADSVLRTQQSPFAADFTALQANNGPISLYTQFMGGVTPYLSHTAGMVQEWRRGGVSSYALARSMVNTYAIPAMVGMAIKHAIQTALFGGGDDDEEEGALGLAKEFSWGMVNNMVAPVPLVRELVGAARYGVNSLVPPSLVVPGRAATQAWKAERNLSEGDIEAAADDFGRAMSLFVPLYTPIRQLEPLAEEWGLVEEE
jgi:hypothetical protein